MLWDGTQKGTEECAGVSHPHGLDTMRQLDWLPHHENFFKQLEWPPGIQGGISPGSKPLKKGSTFLLQ
jgi:hypothetical protein